MTVSEALDRANELRLTSEEYKRELFGRDLALVTLAEAYLAVRDSYVACHRELDKLRARLNEVG